MRVAPAVVIDKTTRRELERRHRHQEWLKFLRMTDQTVAAEKQFRIICDNYATHMHEHVQRWLARHKRFHVHFAPTSASWLHMISAAITTLESRMSPTPVDSAACGC